MALPEGSLKSGQKPPESNTGELKIFLPPNVSLHIFFTSHGSKKQFGDATRFHRLVRGADILIPENSRWNDEALEIQRKIAKGNFKVYQQQKKDISENTDPLFVEFTDIYFDALFTSNAKVIYVDIQDKLRKGEMLQDKLRRLPNFNLSLEQNIILINNISIEMAKEEQAREDHMMENLGPRLKEIIDPNPNLRKKEKVSALMFIGGAHTRIFDVLNDKIKPDASGVPSVSYEINQSEQIKMPQIMLENSYKSGQPEISKETRRRLSAEVVAYNSIEFILGNKADESIITPIVKELSDEELSEIFYSLQISYRKQVTPLAVSTLWLKIDNLIETLSQKKS